MPSLKFTSSANHWANALGSCKKANRILGEDLISYSKWNLVFSAMPTMIIKRLCRFSELLVTFFLKKGKINYICKLIFWRGKIGRASCRERVSIGVVAERGEKM